MRVCFLVLVAMGAPLAACSAPPTPVLNPDMVLSARQQEAADLWATRSALASDVREGALRQHTLYPYQFRGDSAVLTELGRREVGTLAEAAKEAPVRIVVVRGDAPEELYQARTQAVRQAMESAGAAPANVALVESAAAGPGTSAQAILEGYQAERKAFQQAGTGMGSTVQSPPGPPGASQ